MTDPDHIQLLRAFQAGHEAAFEQVFKLFYKPLRMQAFLILKDEHEAEDQVQQLFLDMWNKQLYRNVQQSLNAYLHTAVRNRCYNHLARERHENEKRKEYAAYPGLTMEDARSVALQPHLLAALSELPPQRFHAFTLVHLEDKKYQDAAREMGISINSLKSHLKLAVRFLRMRLQK